MESDAIVQMLEALQYEIRAHADVMAHLGGKAGWVEDVMRNRRLSDERSIRALVPRSRR